MVRSRDHPLDLDIDQLWLRVALRAGMALLTGQAIVTKMIGGGDSMKVSPAPSGWSAVFQPVGRERR